MGISQEAVREANIKSADQAYDMTGQHMLQWNMMALWEQFKQETGFADRLTAGASIVGLIAVSCCWFSRLPADTVIAPKGLG